MLVCAFNAFVPFFPVRLAFYKFCLCFFAVLLTPPPSSFYPRPLLCMYVAAPRVCPKVIDLRPDETADTILFGCTFKEMALRPSVLDSYSGERH